MSGGWWWQEHLGRNCQGLRDGRSPRAPLYCHVGLSLTNPDQTARTGSGGKVSGTSHPLAPFTGQSPCKCRPPPHPMATQPGTMHPRLQGFPNVNQTQSVVGKPKCF